MLKEEAFKAAVLILWLPFLFIRVFYYLKKGKKIPVHPSGKVRQEYRKDRFALFLILIFQYSCGIFYIACDTCPPHFSFPLHHWFRFLSMVTAVLSLVLLNWAHRHLRKNWSNSFCIQEEHQFIQTGPYRLIRHPMYVAVVLFLGSLSCVSASLLILIPSSAWIIFFLWRIPREEAILMEFFGERYLYYREHTGALFPRVRRRDEHC